MKGVDCAIDAVGYQARSDDNPDKEDPTQVLENCVRRGQCDWKHWNDRRLIAPDPGANSEHAKKGIFPFAVAEFFDKGVTMGSGQAPVKKYNEYLCDLIDNGRAKPSKIISHRIQIDQVPDA